MYLYHATDAENIDSILEQGLLINPSKHNWDGMYCEDGIFLAFDANAAEDFVSAMDEPPEEIVVLKVDLDDLDESAIYYDWNNRCEYLDEIVSCIYKKNIPSSILEECDAESEPYQCFDDFDGTFMYERIYDTFMYECETNLENRDYDV